MWFKWRNKTKHLPSHDQRMFFSVKFEAYRLPSSLCAAVGFHRKHISGLIYTVFPAAASPSLGQITVGPWNVKPVLRYCACWAVSHRKGLLALFWIFFIKGRPEANGKEWEMGVEKRQRGCARSCHWNMIFKSRWEEHWCNRLFRLLRSDWLWNVLENLVKQCQLMERHKNTELQPTRGWHSLHDYWAKNKKFLIFVFAFGYIWE